MSRYSAQILICFIANILLIIISSVGEVGTLNLRTATVSAVAHCDPNEDIQNSQHPLHRRSYSRMKIHSDTYAREVLELRDNMDEIHISEELFSTESMWI